MSQPLRMLTPPAPADSCDDHFQGGEVCRGHGHEPALQQPELPAGAVLQDRLPGQHRPLQVQGAPLAAEREPALGLPGAVADPEVQWQPVGNVDQVLVIGFLVLDHTVQAVVDPGEIAAGIVHRPGAVLRGGAAGGPGNRCPGW